MTSIYEVDGTDDSLAMALDDLEAAEKRMADLEAQLAAARSALAAVREVREANR